MTYSFESQQAVSRVDCINIDNFVGLKTPLKIPLMSFFFDLQLENARADIALRGKKKESSGEIH